MDFLFAKDLFTNLAILLSASILSNYIYALSLKKPHIKQILVGLTNGIIGILLLINTVRLNNWIVFDTRSIPISLTALYFGPTPALVAAPIIIAYRIYMGGAGAVPGVWVTIVTMCIGLLWRRRGKHSGGHSTAELYLFGLIVHIFMLLCMFSLPIESALEARARSRAGASMGGGSLCYRPSDARPCADSFGPSAAADRKTRSFLCGYFTTWR